MRKIIEIVKAGEVSGVAPEDVTITITGQPPEFKDWRESAPFFEEQAEQIGRVLEKSLPGGTLDRLMCYLLKRKASYFKVPYVKPTNPA